jgi:hypothetical protein
MKLSFAKNVTPLLRTKKIDFALIFAVNQNQLNSILSEVVPALSTTCKFWIAYPKASSKIVSDLNRVGSWNYLCQCGFDTSDEVIMDHVWTAVKCVKKVVEVTSKTSKTRSAKLTPAFA